jgi:hypothetical protein
MHWPVAITLALAAVAYLDGAEVQAETDEQRRELRRVCQ